MSADEPFDAQGFAAWQRGEEYGQRMWDEYALDDLIEEVGDLTSPVAFPQVLRGLALFFARKAETYDKEARDDR
jgi:hypothetical protein